MMSTTSTPQLRREECNGSTSNHHNLQKITNTGALLDQYQYDDDQTTDLLHAIRNWNLERPSLSQSPDYNNDGNSTVATGATTGTGPQSEIDYQTSSSTITSRGGFTTSSKQPKTPSMGNYSSKPSSLTARILDLPVSRSNETIATSMDHSDGSGAFGKPTPVDFEIKNTCAKERKNNSKPPQVVTTKNETKRLPKGATGVRGDAGISDNDAVSDSNVEPMQLLLQTAAELGLGKHDLHAVLPTVQKLVRVITQHVPRLERFVDGVCEIVEHRMPDDKCESSVEHVKTLNHKGKKQGKSKSRRSKRSMEARKERMDNALNTMKVHWNASNSVKSHMSENIASKDPHAKSKKPTHDSAASDSASSFQIAVKEKILGISEQCKHQERRQLDFSLVATPIATNSKLKDSPGTKCDNQISCQPSCQPLHILPTNEEALEEIQRLIDFDQRYSKLDEFVHLQIHEGSPSSSSPVASGEVASPPQSLLQELLSVDRITLRRFVLHFAYLFNVRQENIMKKINDLYIFSHEANKMIDDLRKAMKLSPNCPIHAVARNVLKVIERRV